MLSDTVQPIEVEEINLIGEGEGQSNLSIATLLKQFQSSTGFRLPEEMTHKDIGNTTD
jgi:flotillin